MVTKTDRNPRVRLEFLDGLRGLSALFVVMHHAAGQATTRPSLIGRLANSLLSHGHYAVAVFIVLSGYCLMIPVACDPEGRLRGGFFGYLTRRARRILPPYYAALCLILAMIALSPTFGVYVRASGDSNFAPDKGTIAAHLLLIHNVRSAWCFGIDPPMWSVAAEWQIYFLFPALIFVWRRFGAVPLVAVAFVLGYLPVSAGLLIQSCPWYLGLFAVGMAAAAVNFSDGTTARRRRERLSGRPVAFAVVLGLALIARFDSLRNERFLDPVVGLVVGASLVYFVERDRNGVRPAALRLLESRWAVALGTFSYSLYLVHYPLLCLARGALRDSALGDDLKMGVMLLAATPACVGASYLFHLAFERSFMPRRADRRPGRIGAAVSPAT